VTCWKDIANHDSFNLTFLVVHSFQSIFYKNRAKPARAAVSQTAPGCPTSVLLADRIDASFYLLSSID